MSKLQNFKNKLYYIIVGLSCIGMIFFIGKQTYIKAVAVEDIVTIESKESYTVKTINGNNTEYVVETKEFGEFHTNRKTYNKLKEGSKEKIRYNKKFKVINSKE